MTAFTAGAGVIGVHFLVALQARDVIGLSAATAGLVLVPGGASALFVSRPWGSFVDRVGGRRAGILGLLVGGAIVATIGHITAVWLLVVVWALAGIAFPLVSVAFQSLAAVAVDENRGGGLSVVLAFRFAGLAVAPVLWLPVFEASPGWAFAGAASLALLGVAALWGLTSWASDTVRSG